MRSDTKGAEPHFLLAAQLARWMDGMYSGATREEVVASFLDAHPGTHQRWPELDAGFLARLQQKYRFLPGWSTKPAAVGGAADPSDWLTLPDARALYAGRLQLALDQLSEVPARMPLTERVAQSLAKRETFANHNVVMVQHMLGQAVPFVGAMVTAGLQASKAEYVGIPYQENPAVKLALERCYGVTVTVPRRGDMDAMWSTVCAAIDRAYARHQKNGEPILVLDDGGYASKYIATRYASEQHLFKVVEQTTRGLTEISAIKPKFPVINVAGSYGKRLESANIGESVRFSVKRVLDELGTTALAKDVLVIGGGKVGLAVAESFANDGSRVTILDPFVSYERRRVLEKKGFRVITDKSEALSKKFLVIGASGQRSIDVQDFAKLSSPVFLASCSSKRVEIDTVGLSLAATGADGRLKRILASRVNEQETWHYWLKNGRMVTAIADGLPVNFQGVNAVPPELIDHTMALMLSGAGQAVGASESGLVELDARAQFRIQAEMQALAPLRRDSGELEVKIAGAKYYASHAEWARVAASPATPPYVLEALYERFVKIDPMHPVVLGCLDAEHPVSAQLVEQVIRGGFLAHVARLWANQNLEERQRQLIAAFLSTCSRALCDVLAGRAKASSDVPPPIAHTFPIAVERDARGGYRYTRCRGKNGGQVDALPGGAANEVAAARLLLSQIAAIGFSISDARVPGLHAHRLELLADPEALWKVSAAQVHLLHNPSWSAEELRALFEGAFGSARDPRNLVTNLRLRKAELSFRYMYDLFEAFAAHPACDPDLKRRAEYCMQTVREVAGDRFPLLGAERWPESALGVPMPEYL